MATDLDELDEDALFEALEKEDNSAYRADRIKQLHTEFVAAKDAGSTKAIERLNNDDDDDATIYSTLRDDQALLDFTTRSSPSRCVVHFSHPDFTRCSVMDDHLRLLASRHGHGKDKTRFARIDVRDCPFVVEKLNVRVLPCVMGFVDGVSVERIVGFEGLGSGGQLDAVNGFRTTDLEKRLLQRGVLVREKLGQGDGHQGGSDDEEEDADTHGRARAERKHIRSGNIRRNDDDDDDDWD